MKTFGNKERHIEEQVSVSFKENVHYAAFSICLWNITAAKGAVLHAVGICPPSLPSRTS